MSDRMIRFAAACVGHLRGGMAYVCQVHLGNGVEASPDRPWPMPPS